MGDGKEQGSCCRVTFFKGVPSGATAIAAGEEHSMVLKQDGTVWATGNNDDGRLGDGTTQNARLTFVKVVSSGAKAIAAGNYYSMVLKTDGTVWAAGGNGYGELGDGTYDARPTFVKVASGATAIAAGELH